MSGNYSGAKAYQDMEMVWNEYFSDPTQWWDNRGKKVSTSKTVSDETKICLYGARQSIIHTVSVLFDKVPRSRGCKALQHLAFRGAWGGRHMGFHGSNKPYCRGKVS